MPKRNKKEIIPPFRDRQVKKKKTSTGAHKKRREQDRFETKPNKEPCAYSRRLAVVKDIDRRET